MGVNVSRVLATLLLAGALLGCKGDGKLATPNGPAAPLSLSLASPADGDFVKSGDADADGQVTGAAVFRVNGDDVDAEGAWSVEVERGGRAWPDSPIWPVLAHAEDADGAWLRRRRTVLAGEGTDAGPPVKNGLALRLTDNALDTLWPQIEAEVENIDLAGELVTGQPVSTILGSDVYVDRFVYTGIEVSNVDFTSRGLEYDAAITGVDTDIRLEVIIVGTQSGTVTADAIDVHGALTFAGDSTGALVAEGAGTNVNFTNLQITGFTNTNSTLLNRVLEFVLEIFIGGLLEDEVIAQIEDALVLQEDLRAIELGGVSLLSNFTVGRHDENGVTIFADSRVVTEDGALAGKRLANPNPPPQVAHKQFDNTDYGAALFLDDDLVSALGVGLTEARLLNQKLSGDLGGLTLDTELVAGFVKPFEQLPNKADMTVVTRPKLAPPASPGVDKGEALRFHVGGLEVVFQVDQDEDGKLDDVLTMSLDAMLGISGDEESLIAFDLVASRATVLDTTLEVEDLGEIETPMEAMFGLLVPAVVGDALGAGLVGEGSPLEGVEMVGSAPVGPAGDYAGVYFNIDLSTQ